MTSSIKTKLTLALVALCGALSAQAADTRWTFDGAIHNNSLAISPDEQTAVASYSERSDLVVYDLAHGTVRAVLQGYVTPRNIVFDPSGRYFYVSDSSLGEVRKIDSHTLETVGHLAAGPGAFGTTLSPDGQTLYVNNEAASTVTRFDLTTGRAQAVVTGFAQPRQGVRVSPDGKTLFVTNFLGDKITLVDTDTNRITGEIGGFDKIRAISVTRDGKTLFAANSGSNAVAVVDVASRHVLRTIPVGRDPYGAALAPDENTLYAGNLADNTLSVVSLAEQRTVATIGGFKEPRQAIVFSHDGRHAFVLNADLSVSKVDLTERRIVSQLSATSH